MSINKNNDSSNDDAKRAYLKGGKFDIIKVKEEMKLIPDFEEKKRFLEQRRREYLQEIEQNEKDHFVRMVDLEFDFMRQCRSYYEEEKDFEKVIFTETPGHLAHIFYELIESRDKNGNRLFKGSINDLTKIICKCFCKPDGSSFDKHSIRMYLSGYRNGDIKWTDDDSKAKYN